MYILPSKYDINYIYILPSKSNYVLKNSRYSRILYSNEHITLNGLYIPIQLNNLQISKKYNKYFLRFTDKLKNIIILEKKILDRISKKKHHNTIIKTSIENKRFVIDSKYPINNNNFILHISGMWENNYEVGLIYKIIYFNHQLPKNTY